MLQHLLDLLDAALGRHRVVELVDLQQVSGFIRGAVGVLLDGAEAPLQGLGLAPGRAAAIRVVLHRVLLSLHAHGEASHLLHLHELVLHHVLLVELLLLLVLAVLHRLLGLLLLQHHLHAEGARVHEHALAAEGCHATRLHHHLASNVVAAELSVRAAHIVHITDLTRHLDRLRHLLVHVLHVVALILLAVVVVVSLGASATSVRVSAQLMSAVRVRALVAVAAVAMLLEVPARDRLVVGLDGRRAHASSVSLLLLCLERLAVVVRLRARLSVVLLMTTSATGSRVRTLTIVAVVVSILLLLRRVVGLSSELLLVTAMMTRAARIASSTTERAITIRLSVLLAGATAIVTLHAATAASALLTEATLRTTIVIVVGAGDVLVAVLVLDVLASELELIGTDGVLGLAQLSVAVRKVASLSEPAVSVLVVVTAPLGLVVRVHLLLGFRIVEVRSALVIMTATIVLVVLAHIVVLLLLTRHAHLAVVLLGHHHLVRETHMLLVVALSELQRRLHLHLLRHHHVGQLGWRHSVLSLRYTLHEHVDHLLRVELLLRGHIDTVLIAV